MTRAGFPIPPGFVICAQALDTALEQNNLKVEIDAILQKLNPELVTELEEASRTIQEHIQAMKLPDELCDELLEAFGKLEDSFTTRLMGQEMNHVSVAVVIQKMIQSDAAGVAFSVHPVTENSDHIVIEGAYGFGEAVVSGQVTPDHSVVSKSSNEIKEKNINEQPRMLVRGENGGVVWQDIGSALMPTVRPTDSVLSDDQLHELASIVTKIESHYGFPCDIEWAIEHGVMYITQSRPITTLSGQRSR